MNASIILLGEVAGPDLDVLTNAARSFDPGIGLLRSSSLSHLAVEGNPLLGCLSFLPCTKESIVALFSSMPLGVGREIPLFQIVDGCEVPGYLDSLPICGVFCSPLSPLDAWNLINALLSRRTLTENNRELMTEIVRHRNQKQQLITIGTALSSHNNFNKLLSLILSESRDLVGADAGSIYLR
jgi:hypothetical protein